jgi:uncharacterized glyoxalase superfamily protein PhnB
MASTSTYLNFSRNTEEAFNYYKSIFGGEFLARQCVLAIYLLWKACRQ